MTGEAGRRGPIARRIEQQAVPPPYTMGPGSRSRIGRHNPATGPPRRSPRRQAALL